MPSLRTVVAMSALAALGSALLSTQAQARPLRVVRDDTVMTLDRLLLPRAVADRIYGSGIECRSIASAGGAVSKLHVGTLRLNFDDQLSVRAGFGMAKLAPLPLLPEENGVAAAAGVTYALWKLDRYSVEVDASALRASFNAGAVTDATVMLSFRGR